MTAYARDLISYFSSAIFLACGLCSHDHKMIDDPAGIMSISLELISKVKAER